MQKLYVGRKYRGKLRSKNKRITFTVVDVTLGGDVMIRRRGYSDTVMEQDDFLEFVAWAKDMEDGDGSQRMTQSGDEDDEDAQELWVNCDLIGNYKAHREQLYGVGLRVTPVELGTYPDGEKCWRTAGTKTPHTGVPRRAGDIHYLHTVDRDDEKYEMALIEDTPEHRQAIQMIFQQFCDLHRALRSVMSEKNLPKLLENVLLGRGRLMFQGAVPPRMHDSRRPRKGEIE